MKHDARCLSLMGLFFLVAVVLGVRPYVPILSDSLHGSNVGAYNMFVASVESRERVVLRSATGTEIVIDHDKYFWMNRFISHTHSRVSRVALERFAEFLVQREEILSQRTGTGDWQVVVELQYRKNNGPWQSLRASRPL